MFESHWECILRLELLQKQGVCCALTLTVVNIITIIGSVQISTRGVKAILIHSQGSHFKPRLRTSIHMDGGLKDIVSKPL